MQTGLEHILEQAQQLIAGLRRLHGVYEPPYDTEPDLAVVIEAYRDPAGRQPDDQSWNRFNQWQQMTAFSPAVFRHFLLSFMHETGASRHALSRGALAPQGDDAMSKAPASGPQNKLLDKSILKLEVAALEQRMGFTHDPSATAEQAQAMMLANGIGPEDRFLTSEILSGRREHEEAP